ncbi:MAG: dihydrolipoyllysine-residue acetyltransferase [Nitrosomonas sp.]|nr:dihydrolipoyllysine-residue acetyltransferase [Nitrosomonas sp.]MCW5607815.1 dihydrolipoyllysine-residue acetyltransferase [Nitrosomonas sp.]
MGELKTVLVPDIGDFSDVPVIEVFVQKGSQVNIEDSLVALESDKATIDIPAPFSGLIREIKVKPGDRVSEGSPIVIIEVADVAGNISIDSVSEKPDNAIKEVEHVAMAVSENPPQVIAHAVQTGSAEGVIGAEAKQKYPASPPIPSVPVDASIKAHAGPSVRRFACELGVNLDLITGSGPKHRILKEDVQAFVKTRLSQMRMDGKRESADVGLDLLPWPQVDFAKYGPVEIKPLSRIKQIAGANLHRNWVMIPHVTQFDEADITDLEALRKESNAAGKQDAVKLTLLSFLMKALIVSLKKFPEFNASLDKNANGETNLTIKRYYHIGFAVDTANGLVVPVIRDVDQKGVVAIARELSELSVQAREGKLKLDQMQGASFTVSSLGGIGGTAFTPIINAPEVAILGVSKAGYKSVYRDGRFVPRLVLPLSLSYDHRVIDGAAAARFTSHLTEVLTDMRLALL